MAEQWFVERPDGSVAGPFLERQISADLLSGKIGSELRVRQGTGPWCPAARARAAFQQLADQGWYVKNGDTVFGPFTADRLLVLSQSGDLVENAEIRQGTQTLWKPAHKVLSLFKTKPAAPLTDSEQLESFQAADGKAKWSTEPIRHHIIEMDSVFPTVVEDCLPYERLVLTDGADNGKLSLTRGNGQTVGFLSQTNTEQLLLNQSRGISHVVLLQKSTRNEIVIVLCPAGIPAEDCRAYIETHLQPQSQQAKPPTSPSGLPRIKT